jgi:hypothetical protein
LPTLLQSLTKQYRIRWRWINQLVSLSHEGIHEVLRPSGYPGRGGHCGHHVMQLRMTQVTFGLRRCCRSSVEVYNCIGHQPSSAVRGSRTHRSQLPQRRALPEQSGEPERRANRYRWPYPRALEHCSLVPPEVGHFTSEKKSRRGLCSGPRPATRGSQQDESCYEELSRLWGSARFSVGR